MATSHRQNVLRLFSRRLQTPPKQATPDTSETAKYLVNYLFQLENLNLNLIPEIKSISRLGMIRDVGFSPYVKGIVFDGDDSFKNAYSAVAAKGSRDDWITLMQGLRGTSVELRILLAASFASVLVSPLNINPFFVHIWSGESGSGKTVALMAAASVWGDPHWQGQAYIQTFNATQVGLTATPCRLDGKPLGATYDTMIVGVTTGELIQQGYLSPYRYFAPSVSDLSSLKRKGFDFDPDSASALLMRRAVYGDVIESYRKYADGLQTICYCSSIKHSIAMADEFVKAGINAVHFDGNTPAAERGRIVQDFRDKKIQILCNVDLISVGFDVPDCWCCILLRPTMSTALHIQQAGRALRSQPGKTAIILDHVGNYTRHGLPGDDREWSLHSTLKTPQQYKKDGTLAVRQCPECFFTFPSGPDKCPNCGAEIKKTRQEIENIKKIHMEEIKHEYRKKAAAAVREKSDISECRNMSEVMAWCKQNGKKPGYGYYYARSKGMIRA